MLLKAQGDTILEVKLAWVNGKVNEEIRLS
jgi:hypothetical protein